MINNNIELAKKAADLQKRLENGSLPIEEAKAHAALLNVYHKASMVELLKHKLKIQLLSHESESKIEIKQSNFLDKCRD